jgi:DnaA family protein
MQQLPLGIRLRDRATFDSFVVGANAELVATLRALASERGGMCWLWGAEGSGRSHLLQAVCAAVPRERRVAYLPLASLPPASDDFFDGWRGFDVVCLDDLPRALGQRAAEQALFRLYRDVEERGAALIVSADTPPVRQPWVLADIGSRFGATLVFEVRELDELQQAEALRGRAAQRGFELPEDTLRYLQRRLPRDMRSMCDLLDALDDAALSAQRRLTIPFIRAVIGDR